MCITFGCGPVNLLDKSIYKNLFHNWPVTSAVRDLVHWVGDAKSGNFSMYDYGSSAANQQHWGQATPPQYDPSAIKTPTAVFIGENDALGDVADSKMLLTEIDPAGLVQSEVVPGYAHADFLYASTVFGTTYKTVLTLLAKMNV
jgi:lysosomal acid lipase/cholesteryl ester hydrolase